MNAATRSKIEIIDAWHIALATTDIDSKVKRFWNDLGIGPWQYMSIKCPERAIKLHGKPVAMDIEAAMAQVGFLAIGYDKPHTRPSPFDEILSKRGGGAHHLAFVVKNYESATAHMRSLGYDQFLDGNEIGPNRDGSGSYFDTVEDLGTVIEFSKLPSKMPEAERVFPASDAAKRTSNINVRGAVHVAIAVRDVDKAVRCYQEVLGIGPWQVVTFTGPAKYRGVAADYSVKAAVITAGTYVLALEQPVSSPSPLQDFLDKNGQGIHHICLEVGDFERASKEMRRLGYEEVFSSRGFGPNKDGDCAYFNTENTLGIVVELAKVPTGDLFK